MSGGGCACVHVRALACVSVHVHKGMQCVP